VFWPRLPCESSGLWYANEGSRIRALAAGENAAKQATPDDLGTAEEDAWDQWRCELINKGNEHRSVGAVLPNWKAWRSRCGFPLS
jgi:hypothetical protein